MAAVVVVVYVAVVADVVVVVYVAVAAVVVYAVVVYSVVVVGVVAVQPAFGENKAVVSVRQSSNRNSSFNIYQSV